MYDYDKDYDGEYEFVSKWAKELYHEIEDYYVEAIPNAEIRKKYLEMMCEAWNEEDISVVSEFRKLGFTQKHYEAITGNVDALIKNHWDDEFVARYQYAMCD